MKLIKEIIIALAVFSSAAFGEEIKISKNISCINGLIAIKGRILKRQGSMVIYRLSDKFYKKKKYHVDVVKALKLKGEYNLKKIAFHKKLAKKYSQISRAIHECANSQVYNTGASYMFFGDDFNVSLISSSIPRSNVVTNDHGKVLINEIDENGRFSLVEFDLNNVKRTIDIEERYREMRIVDYNNLGQFVLHDSENEEFFVFDSSGNVNKISTVDLYFTDFVQLNNNGYILAADSDYKVGHYINLINPSGKVESFNSRDIFSEAFEKRLLNQGYKEIKYIGFGDIIANFGQIFLDDFNQLITSYRVSASAIHENGQSEYFSESGIISFKDNQVNFLKVYSNLDGGYNNLQIDGVAANGSINISNDTDRFLIDGSLETQLNTNSLSESYKSITAVDDFGNVLLKSGPSSRLDMLVNKDRSYAIEDILKSTRKFPEFFSVKILDMDRCGNMVGEIVLKYPTNKKYDNIDLIRIYSNNCSQ